MQDKFSDYIAQLKNKHKETVFRPLFFNGSLSEDESVNKKPIHLYVLMPNNPTEEFFTALTLNLDNPAITSVCLFTNFNDTEPVQHDKLNYTHCSKHFTLQLSDVTYNFKQNEINIVLYDMIVLDYDSIVYLYYLKDTQIGLLSAKTFDGCVPQDLHAFKNNSSYSTSYSEFNAIAIVGKMEDYDLFLDMYGSLNLLISYVCSNYEIINVSKIVLSYLFEEKTYEDTYISDTFPLIYAPVQLYFMEDINVTVPQEESLEMFSKESEPCVLPDEPEYKQDVLPLEDQVLITDIKTKLLAAWSIKYKQEFAKKIETIDEKCNIYSLKKESDINSTLEEYKRKQLLLLDSVHNEEQRKHKVLLSELEHQERERIEQKLQEYENLTMIQAEKKRTSEMKKIDIEIQAKLEDELGRVKKITEDTENHAHIAFKRDIEVFTKTAYSNLEEEIKEVRQQKLREISDEISLLETEKRDRLNKEHFAEKTRLEAVLNEYSACKKQEIVALHQEEYLKKYSSSLLEAESQLEEIKQEKLRQIDVEISRERETANQIQRTNEKVKASEIELKILAYEKESIYKVDQHVKELIQHKVKAEEIKAETELRAFKESTKTQIEQTEMARIKQECQLIKEDLYKQIHLEVELYKTKEYSRLTLEQDAKLNAMYNEKLEEQDKQLLVRESELKDKQDALVEDIISKKVSETDDILRTKIAEHNAELQEIKRSQEAEIQKYIDQFRENEISKIEMSKQLQTEELVEFMKLKQKELEKELSKSFKLRKKAIESELIEEKTKLNTELEILYKEKLETNNASLEEKYAAQLQERFRTIEKENEVLISKLLSSSKRQYETYIEEIAAEKNELEKTVIENHNKQLRELDEEYTSKLELHKSLLKETLKDEKQKLLAAERERIENDLKSYKQERHKESEVEFAKELSLLKEKQLQLLESELVQLKYKKTELIDAELAEYKQSQENLLKKKFQSLYQDLKDF